MSRLPAAVAYCALAAFLGSLAAITVLLFRGVDPLPLVAFLGSVPATVAGAANLLRTSRVESKVDGVAHDVNGHLSRLSDAAGIPPATPARHAAPDTDPGGTP